MLERSKSPVSPDSTRGKLPQRVASSGPQTRTASSLSNVRQLDNKRVGYGPSRKSTDPATGRRVFQRGLDGSTYSLPQASKPRVFGSGT